jgi:diacylglycerol kinase (ATP)
MDIALIYNPTSGDEQHDDRSLRALLEEHDHKVRAASVKDGDWQQLLGEGIELVVVAGGDGTIRKVFKEIAPSKVDVTVLPVGTANNIARTLGLTGKAFDRLIEGWRNGLRRRFDIGEASAAWGTAAVVESLGGGVFADVLARAEEIDDDDSGVELGLRLLEDVVRAAPELDWGLEVDGRDVSEPLLAVEAMNVRETGPNVLLAPDADPGDRRFDVVRVRPSDRSPLLDYVSARLRGESPEVLQLPTLRGTQVAIQPPAGSPLRVDDQLWPSEPAQQNGEGVATTAGRTAVNVLLPRG